LSKKKEPVLGKDTRVLFEIGKSLAITLPKEYIEAHGLKPGDVVDVYFNEVVHVEPVRKEDILKKVKE
jgi:antitoxin component of MazEF toxin-antitoxin module